MSIEFVARAAALGLPGAIAFWTVCLRSRPPRVGQAFLIAGLVSTGLCAGLWLVWRQPQSAVVRIESPTGGEHVSGDWLTVTGSVSPPGMRVLLLVHPQDAADWWVQPEAKVVGKAWTCSANLGTATEGTHQCFQLQAVGSTAPMLVDAVLGRYLPEGSTCRRPPPLQGSRVVTVWRAE